MPAPAEEGHGVAARPRWRRLPGRSGRGQHRGRRARRGAGRRSPGREPGPAAAGSAPVPRPRRSGRLRPAGRRSGRREVRRPVPSRRSHRARPVRAAPEPRPAGRPSGSRGRRARAAPWPGGVAVAPASPWARRARAPQPTPSRERARPGSGTSAPRTGCSDRQRASGPRCRPVEVGGTLTVRTSVSSARSRARTARPAEKLAFQTCPAHHLEHVVGDLEAGGLAALHELGQREVRQRDGGESGEVLRPAEPQRGGQVELGVAQGTQPALGDGQLAEQDRSDRRRW